MPKQIGRIFRRLKPGMLLTSLVVVAASAGAQSSPRSQVVYLPDPTPRPIEPELKLGDVTQPGAATEESVEQRNARRRELVVWAANELVTLSARLDAQVVQPKAKDATSAAAANAQKIEQLAKNLTAALKAP